MQRDSARIRTNPVRPAQAFLQILLAAATLALASCGRLVVLAADPWWSAVSAGSAMPARQVALAALRKGYVTGFVAVAEGEDAGERLAAELSGRRVAVAVIGPPLSSEAGTFAARYPHVKFVLVGGPSDDDGIGNTVQLVFDRTEAFREAGRLAAGAGRTAVLLDAGRPASETVAFSEGVGEVADAPQPLERTLSERPDTGALKVAVSGMRDLGVAVFLYRPSGSRAAFLDVLAAAGGYAVLEDWAASRYQPARVLASIEDDLPSGLGACLVRGAPALVTGTSRVVQAGMREAGEAADEKGAGR